MSTLLTSPTPVPAPDRDRFSLADRYERRDGLVYLTGVQALVRFILDRVRLDRAAGRHIAAFVTGYEGSPLAGFDLELARQRRLLEEHGVVHRPGLNEELAATAVSGSQLAGELADLTPEGVTGYWYGKAPGLDRATDALRHANMIGTAPAGGAVAFVGDDPAAKSSSLPSASEAALADLGIPTFDPADPAEVLELGRHAVELSRACGLWCAVKMSTAVADGAVTAQVRQAWQPPDMSALPDGLAAHAHRPSARLLGAELADLERSQMLVRLPIAMEYLRRSDVNRISDAPHAHTGIVAAGKTFRDVQHALRLLGLDEDGRAAAGIRLLKLGAVFPLEPTVVRRFATGLRRVIVVEDKRPFLEDAVKAVLYGDAAPAVLGRCDGTGAQLFAPVGELDPQLVAAGLARVVPGLDGRRARPPTRRSALPLAPRMPFFCSGCPHNSATKVAPGTLVGGGIGCHAMTLFMPERQVGRVTGLCQMGGEGAQWLGMAPFVRERHFVQNIGDGTFTHSGSLAVRAAVAAGVNITFKLLYNSTVAMTGGQDPVGAFTLPDLVALLRSEGVARVVVTSDRPRSTRRLLGRGVAVYDRARTVRLQRELAAVPGTTVLIHDQQCAAEKRRKRRRGRLPTPTTRVMINQRVCEGCGDCGAKSNCLSVQPVDTEFGRKTEINQSSCNVDDSCLAGDCPSFLTVRVRGSRPPRQPVVTDAEPPPEPPQRFSPARFTIRITGVGGTGVVTVAQIVATAAVLDGRRVRALDQTGLAQKGGAVVSDITVTAADEPGAAKLVPGACDLYLGCDSLVATDPRNLAAATPRRTLAVVSSARVPTGLMVVDPSVPFPPDTAVTAAITAATAEATFLDARALSAAALGDEQYANILLLGVAYQRGALPVSATSIERAIGLNGASVEQNLAAFRLGRAHAHTEPQPGASRSRTQSPTAAPGAAEAAPDSDLDRLVAVRVKELTAYQDARYARAYAGVVQQVRRAEAAATGGATTLSVAVALNLYKLMAYKDEYEVARLSLDPHLRAAIRDQFGPHASHAYRLHPPLLRALGLRRKLVLGTWFDPVLRVLRGMRRLRGTPVDPFGHTRVRRTERALIAQYRALLDELLAKLTAGNHDLAVQIAGLPDLVRGYEQIKLDNVATYQAQLARLLARFRGDPDQPGPTGA